MRLTEKHYLAMEMILKGHRIVDVAEACGVAERTIYRWQAHDQFRKELNNMIVNHGKHKLSEVLDAMYMAAVEDRNAASAKLLMSAHGILTPDNQPQVTVNNSIDLEKIREELKGI